MPLTFRTPHATLGNDISVFLSASIPNRDWNGEFNVSEITDAVVAFARVFLTAGARLVSAAHPTIAPLLLYVAAEIESLQSERVLIYQSQLFEDALPTATRRFEAEGIGQVIWTEARDGDARVRETWGPSLDLMRRQMLRETNPRAAVFIGGMDGIQTEYELFTEEFPERPTYAAGYPGGEARFVSERSESSLRSRLLDDNIYPAMWNSVLQDLVQT
jgi:hypothetical protein